PCAKVTMTGRQITPSVDDGDNGLALKIFQRITHLLGARAMCKRTQVIPAKPAMTPGLFRTLFHERALGLYYLQISVLPACSLCLCGGVVFSFTTTEKQRTRRLHRVLQSE